jgi:phospholipid-binding lipoprotein MlaA|tara:strand:- start:1080 stop:1772 length:693 start_codon:yes stop_codon:yes gene_type:complete
VRTVVALILAIAAVLPALAEDDYRDPDPWNGINRVTHNVNDFSDRLLVRPVALAYQNLLPRFARNGVNNAYSNLGDVGNAVNNLFQGKPTDGMSDLMRVLINSTIGIGGLLDPASALGLAEHEEDWGQTFAKWGVPTGPYVVIPGLGPGSVRDGLARILDGVFDPVLYIYPVSNRNVTYAMRVIHNRADLLRVEKVVFGDRYIFYRDAYLQRREYLANDGEVSDPFADDF